MISVFAIAAGGAIGAVLRHFLNAGIMRAFGPGFPWGIFVINILGSFLMGCMVSWFAHVWEPPQPVKAFLTVGMLGAFTTFSTYSLDAALLIEKGAVTAAAFYAGGSAVLAIAALFAGMILVRGMTG